MALTRRRLLLGGAAGLALGSMPRRAITAPRSVDLCRWIWSGAVTPTSARVKARLRFGITNVRLRLAAGDDLDAGRLIEAAAIDDVTRMADFRIGDLEPATTYHYALETETGRDRRTGRFYTFRDGAMSFRVAFASCASTGSVSRVFETIRTLDPLFVLHMGDLHYLDIVRNDPEHFHRGYDLVLNSPTQSRLYRHAPIVYMWDDHDFGPNDSDRTSPSREAAQQAFREAVPHYPLEIDAKTGRINFAFTAGRVRFLVTDSRSERSPASEPEGEATTMLGTEQRDWLERELSDAADRYPVVIWVNAVPWITKSGPRRHEGWELFDRERTRLADHIKRLGLTERLIMLSGDAHMVALDDGRNSCYASDRGPDDRGFVVMHAAPFDRYTREKGGPYSHGVSLKLNQFGLMEVEDDGGTVRVTLSGRTRSGRQIPGLHLVLECRDRLCREPAEAAPTKSEPVRDLWW